MKFKFKDKSTVWVYALWRQNLIRIQIIDYLTVIIISFSQKLSFRTTLRDFSSCYLFGSSPIVSRGFAPFR
jgi:hypothetical protein